RSLSSPDMHSICYEKFYAAFNNPYDYGVVLDADSIANKGIDLLMTEATEVTLYPFASQHPKDPDNQNALMKLFKVSRKSMPYVHSTSLFSSDAKPFFEDCYWESINLQAIGHSPPNQDETVLNVKLWALEASRYAECYDPYFGFIERYFGDLQAPQHSELYSRERSFVFHGCKSRERASRIFERLREFHRN
ncbi:MAG: hypothetical protein KDD62_12715, partial [Bdellovibrionales bacterium]|nr:hypothetical protein [Bdellovibrionales bacterium]